MKNNLHEINFVLNIDKSYIQQSVVTMTSILLNLNRNYKANFYIFFKWFKEKPEEYKMLEHQFNCAIKCIDVKKYDNIFDRAKLAELQKTMYQNYWISSIPYYRLLMFKILPQSVKYACYIDADIVVDGDLSIEYEKFIKGNFLFASVVDIYFLKKWRENKKYYKKYSEFSKMIKNRLEYPYFCSGFYIANIRKCKEEKIYEQLIDFFFKHPDTQLADQDILNSIFSQKYSNYIHYLPLSYDLFMGAKLSQYFRRKKYYYSKDVIKEAFFKPVVLHYAGPNKPWINDKTAQGIEKWWYYCNKSPAKMQRVGKK